MRLLFISTLFPNEIHVEKGRFNKKTIDNLISYLDIDVVVPIPWFPRNRFLRRFYESNYKRYHVRNFRPEEIPLKVEQNGYSIYYPRFFSFPHLGVIFSGFFIFLSIFLLYRRGFIKGRYDAILSAWLYPDAFASVIFAKLIKTPITVVGRGSDVNVLANNRMLRPIIRYVINCADKVVMVSSDLKSTVKKIGVNNPEKIRVILNGTDIEHYKPLDKETCREKMGLSPHDKIILYAGSLTPIKGVSYLIEAFARLTRKSKYFENTKLVIVGDGVLRKDLEILANNLEVSDLVSFLGIKSEGEMPILINCSDVLCLPSLNEGCPNIILEALSCGKPIVGSNVGGIPEVVSEGRGILVSPGDVDGLARALADALTRAWNAEMVRWTRTWNDVAKEYYKVITE